MGNSLLGGGGFRNLSLQMYVLDRGPSLADWIVVPRGLSKLLIDNKFYDSGLQTK